MRGTEIERESLGSVRLVVVVVGRQKEGERERQTEREERRHLLPFQGERRVLSSLS